MLRTGRVVSCGCHNRENNWNKPLPNRKTRAYRSWQQARDRCLNERHHAWKLYGGRGIEWRLGDDFDAFFTLMSERPVGYELDRIDPWGHYERGNVRWIPRGTGKRRKKTQT
jgi:hypothetical protein